jgi:AraC-like DNA-binding protein
MSTKPTFHDRRARYGIDRCAPQHRAIQSGKIDFHALTKGHYPGTPVPKNILPGLNSIGFWDAGGLQNWGLDEHRNEGIEITFLENGRTVFAADGKKFDLRAGNFTITRPWQLHKLGAPNIGPGRLHWLILDVGVRRPHQDWRWPNWVVLTREDLAGLTCKLRHNENPVWTATPAIASCFRELARSIVTWDQPRSISRLATNLNLLLISVLDALAEQQAQEDEHLASHQRTVEIFLRDLETGRIDLDEKWTLDKMAAYCRMGITSFSKYCRELVNAGPVEYLNQCRLERAAQQLRDGSFSSVTDVALANGFNSSQYFATAFRKRFGMAPKAMRRTSTI